MNYQICDHLTKVPWRKFDLSIVLDLRSRDLTLTQNSEIRIKGLRTRLKSQCYIFNYTKKQGPQQGLYYYFIGEKWRLTATPKRKNVWRDVSALDEGSVNMSVSLFWCTLRGKIAIVYTKPNRNGSEAMIPIAFQWIPLVCPKTCGWSLEPV